VLTVHLAAEHQILADACCDITSFVEPGDECFVIGCGLGLSALPSLIAAQSSVDWHERGVVTGTHMFARSLGSAVGVAVFGAIANTVFGEGDVSSVGPAAIRSGTAAVFLGVLVVAGIAATAVMAMPPTPPERQQASSDG